MKIYVQPEIEILVTRPYYIRSHYTVRPMDELLKLFEPRKEIPLKEKRQRLFHQWVSGLRNNVVGDRNLDWSLMKLQGQKADWKKEEELPVPTILASTKGWVLQGIFRKSQTDMLSQKIKSYISSKSTLMNIDVLDVVMQVWYLDWHSGAFDIKVQLRNTDMNDTEEYVDLAEKISDLLDGYLFQESNEVQGKFTGRQKFRANEIGKWMYDTCRAQLKGGNDSRAPFQRGLRYLMPYLDYSRTIVFHFSNSPKRGYKSIDFEKFSNSLLGFVSEDKEYDQLEEMEISAMRYFACGYGGCVALMNTDEIENEVDLQKAQGITLWKLTLHYFSGLTKLNQQMSNLQQRLSRCRDFRDFINMPEVARFAEFKLRILVLLNETMYTVSADTAFERKIYSAYWSALKGDELIKTISEQLDQTATYIRDRKEEEKAKRSQKLTIFAFFVTLFFSFTALGFGYLDIFYESDKEWLESNQQLIGILTATIGGLIFLVAGMSFAIPRLLRIGRNVWRYWMRIMALSKQGK